MMNAFTHPDTASFIKQMRELIQKGWCTGAHARDSRNGRTHYDDPDACKWCIQGALNLVLDRQLTITSGLTGSVYAAIRGAIKASKYPDNGVILSYFNDFICPNQEAMLEILDSAIEEVSE